MKNNENNNLAIIVAFYLSKYNQEGLNKMGFKLFNEAYEKAANLLNVKKNYVKNRRDDIDYFYPWRKGWKRPITQSIRTTKILDGLEEPDIRDIVNNILYNPSYRTSEDLTEIVNLINNTTDGKIEAGKFIFTMSNRKSC